MCWNGKASTVLATCGLVGCAYSAYKKEPFALWGCLSYFSLMEALQAYTYTVINNCSDPMNQVATLLGFLHIAIQPFFINGISLYFIPEKPRIKVSGFVYFVCFICTILMILKVYPFGWASHVPRGAALCADRLCSVSGNWHIAWELPVNDFMNVTLFGYKIVWAPYIVAAFILPLLYGSWRFTLYHLLLGPILARLTTNNPNEFPAVWCLLSIGFLLIVIKTPIRQILFVRRVWWMRGLKKETAREIPTFS
ncbi:DUF5765 domain-containing protein [Granulicella sp. dw_53]|uniref:DUF5765 domain-containing protein n=1 Tax=Granulicella sp. dw_53 TaxID=2719792 RepID=UPI001BD45CA5|nr:DUF5765 domain-containing protein [Granulicella sp. dw_53]